MNIDALIREKIKLPSPPVIAVRILQAVQAEDASWRELARIISSDPALTAKLLRLANSSMYGLTYQVGSIDKALTVLGVKMLKNIALSFVIAGALRRDGDDGFDYDYFWRRAVTAAVAGELLGVHLEQREEENFVRALLQDIGVLVMHLGAPGLYRQVFEEKAEPGLRTEDAERQVFGFDHGQLGAALLKEWGLPEGITEPIGHHLFPDAAPEPIQDQVALVDLAGCISAVYHAPHGASLLHDVENKLTGRFNVSGEKCREIIDRVANQAVEILSSFDLDPGEMKPYSMMLQEANEELGALTLSYEQLVMELKQAREESERLAGELRRANGRLREMVYRDGLTGLYNHRYFQDVVSRELERVNRHGACFSLILFDIDLFKQVNDSYGHPAGDEVLKKISQATLDAVRSCDTVARYGGEEFAVILPNTEESGLRVFAERLRRKVEALEHQVNGSKRQVTISLGGVTYRGKVNTLDKLDLIDAADRALYQSKEKGRNRATLLHEGELKKN